MLGPFVDASALAPSYRKVQVKRLFVFVNPHGGQGTAMPNLEIAKKIWSDAGVQVTEFKTQRAGHIWDTMRELDYTLYDAVCAVIRLHSVKYLTLYFPLGRRRRHDA